MRELWDAGFRTPEQVAKAGLLKVNPAYHSDLQIKSLSRLSDWRCDVQLTDPLRKGFRVPKSRACTTLSRSSSPRSSLARTRWSWAGPSSLLSLFVSLASLLTTSSRYRRGKGETNDVDILVTFPHQDGKERRVLAKLLRRLLAKGLPCRSFGVRHADR